jgi:hypothetical protein
MCSIDRFGLAMMQKALQWAIFGTLTHVAQKAARILQLEECVILLTFSWNLLFCSTPSGAVQMQAE